MSTDDAKTRVYDEIEALLETLSSEDAAEVMTQQMAATIANATATKEDARDYLNEIRQDILDYLDEVDFDATDDEDIDDRVEVVRN